ncbi:MAG: cytochrome c oxidase subunit 3 [Chitinophagaceae bacterium]|nr:cytochrome c oxidase subunit 3 [Chitinophagaceae bacterium]
MNQQLETSTSNYEPPGGLLIWIVIFLELFTFAAALLVMVYFGRDERELFGQSAAQLNKIVGSVNTVVLISSGFLMALATKELKQGHTDKTAQYLKFTILGGCLFVVIKSIEYYSKIQAGFSIDYDTFFSFYWMLTFFHLLHVVVGVVILSVQYWKLRKASVNPEDFEAGAAFWHLCDLIWLLIFPVIYLMF